MRNQKFVAQLGSGFSLLALLWVFHGTRSELASRNPADNTTGVEELIDGHRFPRGNELRYRGTSSAQMDEQRTVRAILGDEAAGLESIAMSGIRFMLMKQRPGFLKSVSGYLHENDIDDEIDDRLERRYDYAYNEPQAAKAAREILLTSIYAHYPKGPAFDSKYVDYSSRSYSNSPKDMVFTTLYLDVAAYYGDHIVVVKDSDPANSVDLNYWNYKHNHYWVHTKPFWKDLAEFLTPASMPASDIVGLQVRTQYRHDAATHHLKNDLAMAIYKTTYKNEPVAIVFDGASKSCVMETSEGRFEFCESRYDKQSYFPLNPQPTGESARVWGLVVRGDSALNAADACAIADRAGVLSRDTWPSGRRNGIQAAKVAGQAVRVIDQAELSKCP